MRIYALRFGVAFATFCLLATCLKAQVQPPGEDWVAGRASGPWRRLFLDATVVEAQENLERNFHQAAKHPASPVMRKEAEWERNGPYLYGTVMWNEGRLRMWYHHQGAGGYWNSYAESTDGLHWTRPDLGLLAFKGSRHNNLILTRTQDPKEKTPKDNGQCHNPSVIFQPWESDPQRRFALYCFAYDYYVPRVAFSPDGLRWRFRPLEAGKGLFDSGDVVNFFHDPYQRRYVATWKTATQRGRAAGVALSDDGLAWKKPVDSAVMAADDNDPDATQVYGMPVFPYQGLYIGQPWIYNARWIKEGGYTDEKLKAAETGSPCTMDVQLAWSHDLIHWTRTPERREFIARGDKGSFDSDMIYTAGSPVQMGGELYFYYGGFNAPHNAPRREAAIGIAVLRLDGFCSMHAGDREGHLITRTENFSVPAVIINAVTHGDGAVAAEILDQDDHVIPGFSREDCLPFQGDAVRHVLAWKTKVFDAAHLAGRKKLRFWLKNADLYSYLPDSTRQPVLIVYDPEANGGLLPNDSRLPEAQRFDMRGKAGGCTVVKDAGRTCLNLHSTRADKTNASFSKSADWDDDTDWCVEAWYRIVNQGTEPSYGFATFMQPAAGRNVSLYLSSKEAGLMNTQGAEHKVLRRAAVDATGRFHWYRMVHNGGVSGTVTLWVDGREVASVPLAELRSRDVTPFQICFGPNASGQEGEMNVAKFGFRLGATEPVFGPVP